jgi:hypothetical protein
MMIGESKAQRNALREKNNGPSKENQSKNAKGPASMSMSYNNRQSRGNNRSILNESVARIPGIYNENA